jgi:hypothetical protein
MRINDLLGKSGCGFVIMPDVSWRCTANHFEAAIRNHLAMVGV